MDLAYSLYDALVSINVPPDKARVVIDALERDMGTTLATKSDLQLLGQQLESRVTLFEQKVDSRFSAFEQKVDAGFVAFDQKFDARFVATDLKFDRLEDRIASSAADLRKDMEILRTSMTVRLGSMLVGAIGLVLAGIKLLSL